MNFKLILLLTLPSFLIALFFYPIMPSMMASHWNLKGDVDGYMKKQLALFLFPFAFLAIGIMFLAITKIDPLKENIKKFSKYYDIFIFLFYAEMYVFYLQMILWNIDIKIKPSELFPIAFFVLFYYIGIMLEKTKQNWFIGIRTPWTLSSEKVWESTHKIGSKLFKIGSIICLVGIFFDEYFAFFIIIPPLFAAVYTFVFSYLEYKKHKRR